MTALSLQAVVASLQSVPRIELHHKAVLGRLAYELKMRQQCVFCAQLFFHFFASHRVGSKWQASKEHLCHKYIRLGQEAGK